MAAEIDNPTLISLFELYAGSDKMRELVSHNIEILKCVRGGLRMAESHRLEFDPRADYWRLPERRMAVAYLADRWTGRFAPAAVLRAAALQLLSWFDQARPSVVTYKGVQYEQAGGRGAIFGPLIEHARSMPPSPYWEQLRNVWAPYEADLAAALGDDVAAFLEQASAKDKNWEAGFKQRLPWFGYLGTASVDELRRRQAFFYGYANLWTTTNAYRSGGAQNFAPVVQNTKTAIMLDAALAWASSDALIAPAFSVLGKSDSDEEPQERSRHASVLEVYGFLTLQRAPYFITSSRSYREWFHIPDAVVDPYAQTAHVGEITRRWLTEHPDKIETSLNLFRGLLGRPVSSPVQLEKIETPKVKKLAAIDTQVLDDELQAELEKAAIAALQNLSSLDGAAIALHLLLAGKAFLEREEAPAMISSVTDVPEEQRPLTENRMPGKSSDVIGPLPAKLRPLGERALAYLNAGLHVLFAGAPGTGKTTLAQFVGYAWDHKLESLPAQLLADDAPLTTVGNSAWSPFHTIGGLMPMADGTFHSRPGIFIDPTTTSDKVWRLLNCTVILDEMNRADLDRCIGELYPLLSGSVRRVSPAGLPGVSCIEASERFRVIATINDATLDDIVFPISEGLARRFQRIELSGGSRDDVLGYLGLEGDDVDEDPRRAAAYEAIASFYEVARELKLLRKDEDEDRLPFGVAYFTLLREWVNKRLTLPESTPAEQARDLLAASLRPLGRQRGWEEALRVFLSKV